MGNHAILSASAAHRWLACTAAPRFEVQFPETVSEYAQEGTLAHAICELKTRKKFTPMGPRTFTTKYNRLKKEPLYNEEMDKTSDIYLDYLVERAMTYDSPPSVAAEVKVDISDYVPEGFGTCDCIMIGGDTLCITDYKHGKGVPVSAESNPQMRLYALGALKRYHPVYGDRIKNVCMTIIQPRIQNTPSTETITTEELFAWGEHIKPIAMKAYMGVGEFSPGEHCRFCRGKAQCKARADANTALEEFKDCVPQGKAKPGQTVLTNDQIGDLLVRGAELISWYKDLESYATSELLQGKEIPGWKIVAGKSNRIFTDQDAALQAVIEAGYDEALVYERKAKTLTEIEKLIGKTEFAEKLGRFVTKPAGKPTLAPMSDKREPYNSAASDFANIVNK